MSPCSSRCASPGRQRAPGAAARAGRAAASAAARCRARSWWVGMSGVVLAASHFGGVDFVTLMTGLAVVGIGLALVYERRQSLLASMTAHATFNVVGLLAIALSRR